MSRNRGCRIATALFVAAWAGLVSAQAYPTRAIRLVVPFAPGGTFDYVARIVVPKLGEKLGQQVVVDNRPGGGTIIATEIVAKASADGHTLLLGSNVLALNPSLRKRLPYDAQKDLAPIALLASQDFAIGASVAFPAGSVRELISMARSKPGEIAFATAGAGSTGHIAAEYFMSLARINLNHIGYKSGGQSVAAVISAEVPLVFTGLPNVYLHMKAGRMKILGTSGAERATIAPELPAIAEVLPGYEFSNWFGVLAPAATPKAALARLERELLSTMQGPDVRKNLLARGFGVIGAPARQFASTIKSDTAKYGKIIREARIASSF